MIFYNYKKITILSCLFFCFSRAPVQVNLEAKKLKEEIDTALNNSKCAISNKGSSR